MHDLLTICQTVSQDLRYADKSGVVSTPINLYGGTNHRYSLGRAVSSKATMGHGVGGKEDGTRGYRIRQGFLEEPELRPTR